MLGKEKLKGMSLYIRDNFGTSIWSCDSNYHIHISKLY